MGRLRDAPWLYGVAAITKLARVGSRQHWLSDTVAGRVLGYAIGKVFWESSRAPQKGAPHVLTPLVRKTIAFSWPKIPCLVPACPA